MESNNEINSQEDGVNSSHETKPRTKFELVRKPEKLTEQEKREFKRHEETIEKGSKAFWEVGMSLMEILNRKLFKEHYLTFDSYLVERWGFGKSQAYRHINAFKAYSHLSPIGETPKQLPMCESQIRPLVKLKPHQVKVVWNNAVTTAGEKPVTAAIVEAEVAKWKKPKETKNQPTIEEEPEVASNATKNGDESRHDEAFMNMDAAFRDLKKVKGLNDEQKNDWTLLLKDIVEALNKLGVTME